MSVDTKCPNCGATVRTRDAKFCEYCGTELPREAAPPAPQAPSRFGDVAARFRALKDDPEYPALLEHEPSTTAHSLNLGFASAFLAFFVVVAGAISLFAFAFVGPCAIIPLGMAIFGVVMFTKNAKRTAEFANANLRKVPMLVIDERTQITGGGGDSRASTRYFATLESEASARDEYMVGNDLAGRITPGDIGMAYVKADVLIDFRRVRV